MPVVQGCFEQQRTESVGEMSDTRLIIRETDGELDEVVAHNATVHIERMDNVAWWIGITLPDGAEVHVNLGAVNRRAKPFATYWTEPADDDAEVTGDVA